MAALIDSAETLSGSVPGFAGTTDCLLTPYGPLSESQHCWCPLIVIICQGSSKKNLVNGSLENNRKYPELTSAEFIFFNTHGLRVHDYFFHVSRPGQYNITIPSLLVGPMKLELSYSIIVCHGLTRTNFVTVDKNWGVAQQLLNENCKYLITL